MLNKIPFTIAIILVLTLGYWWMAPTTSSTTAASSGQAKSSPAAKSISSETSKDKSASSEAHDAASPKPKPQPKAVVEKTEFNFGSMERFSSSSHVFTIRNEGDAPLQLEVGDSSCSCTLADLEESGVEPGQETHITLEWTLKFKEGPFRQSATIRTNDPDRPEILFAVEGLIQEAIHVSPSELVFSEIPVGEAQSLLIKVASGSVSIADLIIEDPNAIAPLTAEVIPPTSQGDQAFQIKVSVPDTMPKGDFNVRLPILAVAKEGEQKSVRQSIGIQGYVTGGYVVMSPNMRKDGIYEIPPIDTKGDQEFHAIIRVRDSEKELTIKSIKCRPDFVTATLEPQPGTNVKGLYKLTIKVPADAPKGVYRGTGGGDVIVQLDHPRIERIRFYLEMAINR